MHGNAHLWCNINQALLWIQSINITDFLKSQILQHIPRNAKAAWYSPHDQYFVTTAILWTNKYSFIAFDMQPLIYYT